MRYFDRLSEGIEIAQEAKRLLRGSGQVGCFGRVAPVPESLKKLGHAFRSVAWPELLSAPSGVQSAISFQSDIRVGLIQLDEHNPFTRGKTSLANAVIGEKGESDQEIRDIETRTEVDRLTADGGYISVIDHNRCGLMEVIPDFVSYRSARMREVRRVLSMEEHAELADDKSFDALIVFGSDPEKSGFEARLLEFFTRASFARLNSFKSFVRSTHGMRPAI